ncbi:Gfo/Idh/MocA family protein [Roseivirga thermotolerans]|uniref:Gfo/Idh/MocA family protein n=1 Tax=Roseivirga thermotolerans TaxID=1758176 RepID=UPI00273DC6F9|nr:Gfo/Idh/MocA family oxidoreductase [Roseivirga thermotolerans]
MDRRKFIATGGAASLGLALAGSSVGAYTMRNKINVGVIGTGDRGTGLMSLLRQVPDMEVVACSDLLPFRLENALKMAPKAKGYADYKALLDRKDVDAVLVAVPFGVHTQVVLDALDAGKHIYCEKTMIRGYSDIKKVAAKVRASNKIFQTGHQYHSSRLYTHLVEKIQNGLVGEITAIECQWNRNGDWRRPVPDPKFERIINWRMYKEWSGGLVAELCSHQIDFTNWLLKETPSRVMGSGGIDYWKDGRETFDNVHLIVDYPSGVKAKYTCTTINSLGDYQIKVLGKKGTVQIDYDKAWFFAEPNEPKQYGNVDGVSGATIKAYDNRPGYQFNLDHKDPTLQALLDFQEAIVTGEEPLSNVVTGGHAAMVVQMALDAIHNNKIVSWKDEYTLG